MFDIWFWLLIFLSSIEFIWVRVRGQACLRGAHLCVRLPACSRTAPVLSVGLLLPFRSSAESLSAQDSMVCLSSLGPAMHPPQRISVWAQAIREHIQAIVARNRMKEPLKGPTDAYLLFTTYQVVNSLPCWRWSKTLNTGLFTHKHTNKLKSMHGSIYMNGQRHSKVY